MSKVIADISMSLDGFITGPKPDLDHGLGLGGGPLHTWAFDTSDEVDADVLRSATASTGAIIMGRRLFDFVDGPNGWSDDLGYGAQLAASPPAFVVTHEVPETVRLRTRFTFITAGIGAAIEAARHAACGKDVVIMGGGNLIRQAIAARLAEELRVHLVPIILGSGTPLFEDGEPLSLRQVLVRVSGNATHLTYALA